MVIPDQLFGNGIGWYHTLVKRIQIENRYAKPPRGGNGDIDTVEDLVFNYIGDIGHLFLQ